MYEHRETAARVQRQQPPQAQTRGEGLFLSEYLKRLLRDLNSHGESSGVNLEKPWCVNDLSKKCKDPKHTGILALASEDFRC